jgi:hypothetical protein
MLKKSFRQDKIFSKYSSLKISNPFASIWNFNFSKLSVWLLTFKSYPGPVQHGPDPQPQLLKKLKRGLWPNLPRKLILNL